MGDWGGEGTVEGMPDDLGNAKGPATWNIQKPLGVTKKNTKKVLAQANRNSETGTPRGGGKQ